MYRPKLQTTVNILAFVFLCSFYVDAAFAAEKPLAEEVNTPIVCDRFGYIRDFLGVFFPQLKREGIDFDLRQINAFSSHGSSSEYVLSILTESGRCGLPGHVPRQATLSKNETETRDCSKTRNSDGAELKGYVIFAAELGRISTLEVLPDKRYPEFVDTVDKHPEWSETKIDEELRRTGATYGRDNEPSLLKELPLEQLQRFLGKVSVQSIQFLTRSETSYSGESEKGLPELLWELRLKPDESERKDILYYRLLFEPFTGRLISLSLHPKSK